MALQVDLHSHSTASDGELGPVELLQFQAAEGIELAAITDHDTLDGFDGVATLSDAQLPRLISGIEFSARRGSLEVHVVGLGFDPADTGLRDAVAAQAIRREARARTIAGRLEELGHPGGWEWASVHAGGSAVGRPHFAQFLVARGAVRDAEEAFRRYLGDGKPAWCRFEWPLVEDVVGWIRAAGGVAVLAHPLVLELGRGKLKTLLAEFRECGGGAAEVALAGIPASDMHNLARLVRDAGLRASAGSDYHSPRQFWRRPSRIPPLPDFLEPVWSEWL